MAKKFQVRGADSLKRKLGALGEVGRGRLLERALTSGALLIQNEAKRHAPYLTGNLRRSIHIGGHKDLNTDSGNVIERGNQPVPEPRVEAAKASVYVGTDVVYAAAQEFGTEHIPAQPYLRPAVDTQRRAVSKEVGEALKDLIKKAAS